MTMIPAMLPDQVHGPAGHHCDGLEAGDANYAGAVGHAHGATGHANGAAGHAHGAAGHAHGAAGQTHGAAGQTH